MIAGGSGPGGEPGFQLEEWFEPMSYPYPVLWRIAAGTTPTVEEAQARLLGLRVEGPAPPAFSFCESCEPSADGAAR